MATALVVYEGELHTVATHLKSGSAIHTDAPTDNFGKGEAFSPTDLMATSLANCILTTMGIKCNQNNWNIDGTSIEVTKIMGTDPRRIVGIDAIVKFPKGDYDLKTRTILERTAVTCPVAMSFHPDIQQNIIFHWD